MPLVVADGNGERVIQNSSLRWDSGETGEGLTRPRPASKGFPLNSARGSNPFLTPRKNEQEQVPNASVPPPVASASTPPVANGDLCDGHPESHRHESEHVDAAAWAPVLSLTVACGRHHTVAIERGGATFSWGGGGAGQLGVGKLPREKMARSLPSPVGPLSESDPAIMVACAASHTAAVAADGSLFVWGEAHGGELGIGVASAVRWAPQRVVALSDRFIKMVACGNQHTVALTSTLEVFSWGHGALRVRCRHRSHAARPCPPRAQSAFALVKVQEVRRTPG